MENAKLVSKLRLHIRKLDYCYINKVLVLLHVDLMGPMQIESLGEKKYAFVCVDDYSRYTWIKFLREKSTTNKVCKTLCLHLQYEQEKNIV